MNIKKLSQIEENQTVVKEIFSHKGYNFDLRDLAMVIEMKQENDPIEEIPLNVYFGVIRKLEVLGIIELVPNQPTKEYMDYRFVPGFWRI